MDLITLTLNKNHIWSGISIIGLGALTYLTNRYMSNTKKTQNQSYYKPTELIKGIPNLNYINNNINNNRNNNTNNNTNNNVNNIVYIFWNGDMNSTYILIDLLVQDKIIQPLYIERYTIIKELEKDELENIIKKQKQSHQYNKDKNQNVNIDTIHSNYLKNIVLLKKTQDYELKQLEMLRLMILGKYPEFTNNLFPTTYITSIEKDLEMTSLFYNSLQTIKPIYYDGIDFIEQVLRYLKYSGYIKKNTNNTNNTNTIPRIILGCNKDYKNEKLLINLIDINIVTIIDFPLKHIDNNILKNSCVTLFPNDIMKYFLSKTK
jgi:hypothetical protein